MGGAFAAWTSWPALSMPDRRFLPALAVVALVALGLGLVGIWVAGLGWGVGLLGAAYLIRLQLDPSAAGWAPIAAGWLLFAAELGYWSYEVDGKARLRGSRASPRILQMVMLAMGAALAGELVVAGSNLLPSLGPWSIAGGAAALVAVLGVLLRLARRGVREAST